MLIWNENNIQTIKLNSMSWVLILHLLCTEKVCLPNSFFKTSLKHIQLLCKEM